MTPDKSSRIDLQNIQIASPCPMSWDDMAKTSDEAKRFCGDCRKHVYSIDQLTREEATQLIERACASDSSVCVRLFKRADGTIITDDCPVGLRRIRAKWRQIKTAVASALLFSGVLPAVANDGASSSPAAAPLLGRVAPKIRATMGEPMMIDYRAEALKVPSIKALADKVNGLEKNNHQTSQDKIAIVEARLKTAREGMRKELYMFASQELTNDIALAKQLPEQTNPEKSDRKRLLKELITDKLTCLKQLKIADCDNLQKELKALDRL